MTRDEFIQAAIERGWILENEHKLTRGTDGLIALGFNWAMRKGEGDDDVAICWQVDFRQSEYYSNAALVGATVLLTSTGENKPLTPAMLDELLK